MDINKLLGLREYKQVKDRRYTNLKKMGDIEGFLHYLNIGRKVKFCMVIDGNNMTPKLMEDKL